jgi:outer membrane protein OmpA-like peptidoglycan-associated protein
MKIKIPLFLLFLVKCLPAYCQSQDTIQLFYDINQQNLTSYNEFKLDSINDLLIDTSKVYIFGFADYLGKKGPNYLLSKQRAEIVKDYLLYLHGKNIFIADGKGQVNYAPRNPSPLGEPVNRRVDIIVTPSLKHNKPVHRYLTSYPPLKKTDSLYKRIDKLATLDVGQSLSFKEMTFLPGRHFLNPQAVPILEALTTYLLEHKNLKIEIQGHICCEYVHHDAFDIDAGRNTLSINRAKYIYGYMVSKGVRPDRMLYKGLGSDDPKIFPEKTIEDQNQNRRVVIVLLGK